VNRRTNRDDGDAGDVGLAVRASPASPRSLLGAVAIAMLLAGCLAGDDDPADGGGPADPSSTAWDFEQILVGPGGDAETSVVVTPDGEVLACTHGGFGQPSPAWRSLDGGTTWARMDPQPNPLVSGDCDFAVLDDGTWAIVYDTIASATVAVSTDRGESWSFNYASALPVAGVDRPWLASQGDTMYLAYANVMAVEPAVNMLAISEDGGRTWTEHHVAHTFTPEQGDQPNTIIGKPIVRDQTIRIPLASANLNQGGPTTLSFAVSRDHGETWVEEMVAGPYDTDFHLPVAGQDGNGTLFITLVEDRDGALAIDVLVSRDDGGTWDDVHVAGNVTFAGGVSGPWIDVRPDGVATIAWLSGEDEGRSVWAARLDADGVLRPAQALTAPVADESLFEFIMLDHDAAGRAYIVYPMDTGDCSRESPAAPGRNVQCVWLLREAAAES
jgi:hypothetical protein